MTLDEVIAGIKLTDAKARSRAAERQDQLTKPPGSLGRLEDLSVQLAGIFGTERPAIRRKTVIVAAADHGVTAQSVTGYPQEVTAQMVLNFLNGGAAINVIARTVGVDLMVVDAGVAAPLPSHPNLRVVGWGRATGDISRGPAMSRSDAGAVLMSGVKLAMEAADSGADVIGTGDMGIGNTTPSSAITSAITGKPAADTTGRGTGRSDAELEKKATIVQRALEVNQPDPADGLDVLAKVGGFEIGVLAGVILGGALAHRPVVLDGFISGAAALIARQLCPTASEYMIAAHRSAESGHRVVLAHLGLKPLLDLDMRLGEGTGSALAMPIIEAAASCLSDMATFEEASVSNRPSGSDSPCDP